MGFRRRSRSALRPAAERAELALDLRDEALRVIPIHGFSCAATPRPAISTSKSDRQRSIAMSTLTDTTNGPLVLSPHEVEEVGRRLDAFG